MFQRDPDLEKPVGIPREVPEDTTMAGYFIPRGTSKLPFKGGTFSLFSIIDQKLLLLHPPSCDGSYPKFALEPGLFP